MKTKLICLLLSIVLMCVAFTTPALTVENIWDNINEKNPENEIELEGDEDSTRVIDVLDTTTDITSSPDTKIQQAIADGMAWLAGHQKPDGSWGGIEPWLTTLKHSEGTTALVLIKFQTYAWEEFDKSPFDPSYQYNQNVLEGWKFLFKFVEPQQIGLQTHEYPNVGWVGDDPDFDPPGPVSGNGIGYSINHAGLEWHDRVYATSLFLSALVAGQQPDRLVAASTNSVVHGLTYRDVAQDVVDWLAFAQGDLNDDRGGFYYAPLDNTNRVWLMTNGPCNSNSGYAYLGLQLAESIAPLFSISSSAPTQPQAFACTVPQWVKEMAIHWVSAIQDTASGGSLYRPQRLPPTYINDINLLKTGNLIFEMTFAGIPKTDQNFKLAIDYIENNYYEPWIDWGPGWGPGWGYLSDHTQPGDISGAPAAYQDMFCLMKGLDYSGISLLNTGSGSFNWWNQYPSYGPPYDDFVTVIVEQQNNDGSWSQFGISPNMNLSTAWALLVLERFPTFGGIDNFSKWDDIIDCVQPCEYINYHIHFVNELDVPIPNVVVSDLLPPETIFDSAGPQPVNVHYLTNGDTLVEWIIGNLPAHSSVTLWLRVLVRPETTGGTIIHNEAVLTGSGIAQFTASEYTRVCCPAVITVGTGINTGVQSNIFNPCNPDDSWECTGFINLTGIVITGRSTQFTITNLSKNETITVTTEGLLGFGPTDITVTINAPCGDIMATAKGFMLGPLVYVF